MKKLTILLAFVSFTFTVMAASDEGNFVSVRGKQYFSKNVKIGNFNARIILEDGRMLKASLKEVDAYRVGGKLFERMPLISIDGTYEGTALLEFIAQRGELRLYKYCTQPEIERFGCRILDQTKQEARFLVYQDRKLYLHILEQNAGTILPFFGLKVKLSGVE